MNRTGRRRPGETVVRSQLGRHPGEQHRLAPAARRDHEEMLAGGGIDIAPQNVQHQFQFALPDDELSDQLAVRLKRSLG